MRQDMGKAPDEIMNPDSLLVPINMTRLLENLGSGKILSFRLRTWADFPGSYLADSIGHHVCAKHHESVMDIAYIIGGRISTFLCSIMSPVSISCFKRTS